MDRISAAPHLDDEALSVLLDAETGAPAGAEGHLAGCTRCAARRDELAAARDSLADTGPESVDELTRRRLIAAALAEAPATATRPRHFRPVLAGGVAAALLALFAAVPFLTDRDKGLDQTATATSGESEMAAGGAFLGDLGDVSDPATLRGLLGPTTLAAGAESRTSGRSPAQGSAPDAATDLAPAAPEAMSEAQPYSSPGAARAPVDADTGRDAAAGAGTVLDRAITEQCTQVLSAGPARGAQLMAVGLGTYQGTPATVAAYSRGAVSEVFITARDDCRILARYRL